MQLRSESLNQAEQVQLITIAPNQPRVRGLIKDLGNSFLKVNQFRLLSELIEILFQNKEAETKIDIDDENKFNVPLLANQSNLDSTLQLYSKLKQIEQDGKKILYDIKPHALILIREFKDHNDLLKQIYKTKVKNAFVLVNNKLFHFDPSSLNALLMLNALSDKGLISIFNNLKIIPLSANETIRIIEKLDKSQIKILQSCTELEEKAAIPKKYKPATKIQFNKDEKYNLRPDAIGNNILSFLSDRNKCTIIMNINKKWRSFVRNQPVTGDYIPIVREDNDCYIFVNWKSKPATTIADFHYLLFQLEEKEIKDIDDWIDPPDKHGQKQTTSFNLFCASFLLISFGALSTYLGVVEDNSARKLIYEIAASFLLFIGLVTGCLCCGRTVCCKKQGMKDAKNLQFLHQLTPRQKTVLDDLDQTIIPSHRC